jgi:hypothetical protein
LPLPESEDGEIDYLQLATILASPDERMNSNVIEGLHVITSLGTGTTLTISWPSPDATSSMSTFKPTPLIWPRGSGWKFPKRLN